MGAAATPDEPGVGDEDVGLVAAGVVAGVGQVAQAVALLQLVHDATAALEYPNS